MRRIEQDEIERIIGKRHLAEVPDDIGPDLQSAPIAKGMFLAAAVHEDRIGVVFVEPAHPTAAASIQNLFHTNSDFEILGNTFTLASAQKSFLISNPYAFRPILAAASRVVPLPAHGSMTTSP